jgi:hypothetical protein
LRSFIEAASSGDADVEQAFRRLELQVAPLASGSTVTDPAPAIPGILAGSAAPSAGSPPGVRAVAPSAAILENPQEAYRAEIRDALMDAMLEHSRGLGIAPDEWLTVAARGNEVRARLAPVNTDVRTVVIKVKGADLNAFLGGQLSREEARKRMDVRVF